MLDDEEMNVRYERELDREQFARENFPTVLNSRTEELFDVLVQNEIQSQVSNGTFRSIHSPYYDCWRIKKGLYRKGARRIIDTLYLPWREQDASRKIQRMCPVLSRQY